MKQYTHAWLAFMAMRRLEKAKEIVCTPTSKSAKNEEYQSAAASLVKWFKDYRDFVIKGAWYPDAVFKDMATSHIIKYNPLPDADRTQKYRTLRDTSEMQKYATQSPVYRMEFEIQGGNCADRCEALSHGIVDCLKMQFLEDKGNPISPTNNHLANRFFILSHYVADCHMPLHCDSRQFSSYANIHGLIEKNWEDQVLQSYSLDEANCRFFYDPEGYPLHTDNRTALMDKIEAAIEERQFVYEWPSGSDNTWDYMSAVSQISYYMAYVLFPLDYNVKTKAKDFKKSDTYLNLDDYSFAILFDAIDSIARVWVHAWHKFLSWEPYQEELARQKKYAEWESSNA